jgi:VanZ family protein
LAWRSGLEMRSATMATAALLAATSYAQVWLPGRSAEVTDAVLALMVGWVFRMLTVAPG